MMPFFETGFSRNGWWGGSGAHCFNSMHLDTDRAEGRIVSEKRPYVHAVGHCSRCKTVVEPRLSLQWWVRVGPLAKAAGDALMASVGR